MTENRSKRGSVTVFMLILLPALFLLAAMVINIAHVQLVQTELHISTDLSARAAGYKYNLTQSETEAIAAANLVGDQNHVNGKKLEFTSADIEFGQSVRSGIYSRYDFQPSTTNQNAIRLTGRKTSASPNGQVNVFLPSLLGRQFVELEVSSISTQVEIDIALVLDRSGSMAYADDEVAVYPPLPKNAPADWEFSDPAPPGARWHDVVDAVNVFIGELNKSPQNEQVSLVTYADFATTDLTLSTSYSSIATALGVHTNSLNGGGTNIESGLVLGKNSLVTGGAREFANKVVIVMTDGRKNLGGSPVYVAQDMADDGIMVFTVTFSNEADQSLMKSVASAGKGDHFHATTGDDLKDVFREIGRRLPSLLTK